MAQDAGVLAYRFWRMTPADLVDHVEVHRRREKQQMEHFAQLAQWILAGLVEKPPSIDRLLGRVTDA